MIEFKIDVRELERMAAVLPALREDIEYEIETAMIESGQLLTAAVAGRTPVNFGTLRQSIQFPTGFATEGTPSTALTGIIRAGAVSIAGTSPRVYANYVEFGTRPHWAPIAPLKLWAIRKFGDERMAYVAQQRIAFIGTQPVEMFKRAWEEVGKAKVTKIWQRVPAKAIMRHKRRTAR